MTIEIVHDLRNVYQSHNIFFKEPII